MKTNDAHAEASAASDATHDGRAISDGSLAAWEITSVVVSVLIVEWVILSVVGDERVLMTVPVLFVFAIIFYSHRQRGETLRQIGFRFDNFLPALLLLVKIFALPAAALIVGGWLAGTLDFTRWRGGQSIFGLPALGIFWGLIQQYALQGFINRRAQIVWGRGQASIVVTALIFALLHFPNPWLTLATLAGGLVWAYVYQIVPNLYAAGLTHGLLTWVLVSAVPPALLNNLRVGYKFFG